MKYILILLFVFNLSSCSKDDMGKEVQVKTIVINGDNLLSITPKQLTVVVLPSDANKKEVIPFRNIK